MTHLVPAVRIIAALMFSAALAGGVATANAKPCQMYLPNGQLAPCAPDVISTEPGEYGGGNDAASDPGSFEHTPLDRTSPVAAPPVEEPVDDHQVDIPQPEEKDPDKEKEEKAQKEKEEREAKEKEEREAKEKEEREAKEKEQKEKEQNG